MAKRTEPCFWFYPLGFLAESDYKLMSTEAIGACILLMCFVYLDGDEGLSGDPKHIARVGRFDRKSPRVRQRIYDEVRPMFIVRDGYWYNKELFIRAKQGYGHEESMFRTPIKHRLVPVTAESEETGE